MQENSYGKICIPDNLQNIEYSGEENSPSINNATSSLNSNLIVNYLPHDIDDLALKGLFIEFGEILMTKVVRDKNTNKSLGYGFVKFLKDDDASRAIQKLNGFVIDNKYLKVTIARPPSLEIRNCKLYVTNLPLHYSENNVVELFQDFGEIIECRVIKDKTLRVNKGVAFVQFNLNSQANAALSLNGYKLGDSSRGLVIKYAEDQHKKKELTKLQGLTISEYDSSPYSRSMNTITADVDNSIDHSIMNNDRNNQPTTFYYYLNQQHQQQQQQEIHSPINTNTSVAHQVHHLGNSNPQNIYNNNHINHSDNNMNNNMYANHQSHPMLQHLPVGMQQTSHMNVPAMTTTHYSSYPNHPVHHNMPIPQPQATHMSQHTTMLFANSNYNNNSMKGEYIPNQPSIYAINNWYNPTMSYTQHIGDINMSNQLPYVHNNSSISNSHTKYSPQQTTIHNNNINSNTKKGLITTSSVTKQQQQQYNTSLSSYTSNHFTKNSKSSHNNYYVKHNSADNNNNTVTPSLMLVVSNLPLNIDVQAVLYKLFSAYGKMINSTNESDSSVDAVKYSIEIIPYNIHTLQLAVHNMNGSYCVSEGSSPIQVVIYT